MEITGVNLKIMAKWPLALSGWNDAKHKHTHFAKPSIKVIGWFETRDFPHKVFTWDSLGTLKTVVVNP